MSAPPLFAHSITGKPEDVWEPLADHLARVASRAGEFAAVFGWGKAAELAGWLHDLGKSSRQFQQYIRAPEGTMRGGDHSSAGAIEAKTRYGDQFGKMLAFVIAGHHAGLANGLDLNERLKSAAAKLDLPAGWDEMLPPLPSPREVAGGLASTVPSAMSKPGFDRAFRIRMLFSCLVDADFLETGRFYDEHHGREDIRGGHATLAELRLRLTDSLGRKQIDAKPSPINALRREVLEHACGKASLKPGLFTLTVPTGGGKTLTSLAFALDHAQMHRLRRVVYVIPYTSIIEQTAQVFRDALQTEADVLEHHSSVDWRTTSDEEGRDGFAKLRMAAENWDVPVVVTTAVQFFESLFANRTSQCRKLHNLAGSVIVLDEAQTLPLHLLRPCLAAIDELATNYGASVVLCTATQPAVRAVVDEFANGLPVDDTRELAPDPARLYAALRRVKVEHLREPIGDDVIAARFAEQPRMLCIVNSRKHAASLYKAIADLPGAVHLTTLMCPRHRREVLAGLRWKLKETDEPVRIVSTSLIEAGVDIDLPEVWRAMTGIDSIAQAAGRCNREGRQALGRVVVFTPAEAKPPRSLRAFADSAASVLRRHDDPISLEAVRDYFRQVYWVKESALDRAVKGEGSSIMQAHADRARSLDFPFESIAEAFRLIDEVMVPVVVPWKATPDDDAVERIFARIAGTKEGARPRGADLRALQPYMAAIPKAQRDLWLRLGVLRPVHRSLGEDMLRFGDLAHYDPATGVRLNDPMARDAEANIM